MDSHEKTVKYEANPTSNDKEEMMVKSKTESKEYVVQSSELVAKCMLTCIVFEGHEKPIQKEMYERHADARITSNLVLCPGNYKDLLKVKIILMFFSTTCFKFIPLNTTEV